MTEDTSTLTAKERLALSREAIVIRLHGGKPPPSRESALDPSAGPQRSAAPAIPAAPVRSGGVSRRAGWLDRFAWTSVARNVAQRWWRRHPANAAAQLARPLLDHYARQRPATLVVSAAATGALIVLVRPWRLLSVTALLATLLKTSDIADLVTTLMHRESGPAKEPS